VKGIVKAKHKTEGKYAAQRRQQAQMAALVSLKSVAPDPVLIAGLDVAYELGQGMAFAAAVLYSFPALELLEAISISQPIAFPYVPGLLSFRELPSLLSALGRLSHTPDLLLVDGQGICHPRGLGLASHLGVASGIASIGAAKSRLCGDYVMPELARGNHSPLLLNGEEVGSVLCTRTGVKPLFISPGHLCDIASAIRLVLACCRGYRLPEPARQAHRLAEVAKRNFAAEQT
jgi:deoxyribonuclease V